MVVVERKAFNMISIAYIFSSLSLVVVNYLRIVVLCLVTVTISRHSYKTTAVNRLELGSSFVRHFSPCHCYFSYFCGTAIYKPPSCFKPKADSKHFLFCQLIQSLPLDRFWHDSATLSPTSITRLSCTSCHWFPVISVLSLVTFIVVTSVTAIYQSPSCFKINVETHSA